MTNPDGIIGTPEIFIPMPGHQAPTWKVPYIGGGLVDSEIFAESLRKFNEGGGWLNMADPADGEVAVPRLMAFSLRRPPIGIRYEEAPDGTGRMWLIDSVLQDDRWQGDIIPTGQVFPDGSSMPKGADPITIQPDQPFAILAGPGDQHQEIEVHVGFTNVGPGLLQPGSLAVHNLVVNTFTINTIE